MTVPVRTRSLVEELARRGDALAVVTPGLELSYGELAVRVAEVARRLGTTRRLVALEGANTVEALTGYLAALAARCPLLLLPPGADGIAQAYDPDVVLRTGPDGVHVDERRAEPAHALHDDLALLLTTSGTSGSPKLVRLSYDNLRANAAAIAEALGVRPDDRAMASLPMHYCYGLSVLNSHLLVGATVVLSELSVVDACYWDLFRRAGATTFAGVPYTFELLDRVGFDGADLPTLRYVTQAGGRLAPDRVRHWATVGERSGWDLVVMYGQTEATARMAVLPPHLARTRPEAIGLPVPGGAFAVEDGELVYQGPNVMLGYATTPADLALGRTVERLRTGDLARRAEDGLYEVVGRKSRFLKVFGLRIDQEHLEQSLGGPVAVEGVDGRVGVLVEGGTEGVLDRVCALTGLPRHAVRVAATDRLPRLPSGKVDHPAATALLQAPEPAAPAATRVRALFADVLGVEVGDDDTFIGLGGDSLSYVEVSVALEDLLPRVPDGWHLLPVRELEAPAPAAARRQRTTLDTTVALRAVAILLIVGTHADLFQLLGGAHVLVAVAGWNFARFHLRKQRAERRRSVLRSVVRTVVPTVVWAGAAAVVIGAYDLPALLLLNNVFGPEPLGPAWRLWFIEAIVQLLLGAVLLLAVPGVARWERRRPFGFAVAILLLGLALRYDLLPIDPGPYGRVTPQAVLWLFALGWAGAVATTRPERLAVCAVALLSIPGSFGNGPREAVVVAGLLLLLTVGRVPSTRLLNRIAGALAAASLQIYVSHWQVFPYLKERSPALAVAASLAVGLTYWQAWGWTARRLRAPSERVRATWSS